jgi:hypothetical protein
MRIKANFHGIIKNRRGAMLTINMEVLHKAFGKGTVVSMNGKYFTVQFGAAQKTFVYPDAFEKFLTLADGSTSEVIDTDLQAAKEQKQKELDKKNEENRRAMTHGIVIPGKENVNAEGEDEEGRFKNSDNEEG